MDESTMLVVIETLAKEIKELQIQNRILKYENERLREENKSNGKL